MERDITHRVATSMWRSLRDVLDARRPVVLFLGSLFTCVLLMKYNPVESRWFPPCPFKYLTGWYCPGCGSTRALHNLLHGRIVAAFGYNPLMVACIPFLLVNGVGWMLPASNRRLFDERALSASAIVCILVGVVLFGVLRNLPMYPFSFLAPHG